MNVIDKNRNKGIDILYDWYKSFTNNCHRLSNEVKEVESVPVVHLGQK